MTNKMAQMRLGKLRTAERKIRTGSAMDRGIKFRAASEERVIAPTKPKTVETNAILIVSIMPR